MVGKSQPVPGRRPAVLPHVPYGPARIPTALSDFQGFANQIQHEVCESKDMPHAQVPFGVDETKVGFWNDAVAQHDLGNFLHGQNINTCLPHD
jgi:hypothetical protein